METFRAEGLRLPRGTTTSIIMAPTPMTETEKAAAALATIGTTFIPATAGGTTDPERPTELPPGNTVVLSGVDSTTDPYADSFNAPLIQREKFSGPTHEQNKRRIKTSKKRKISKASRKRNRR